MKHLFLLSYILWISTTEAHAPLHVASLPTKVYFHHNASLNDPQTLRCFTEQEAEFPISKEACSPVLRMINERYDASRPIYMTGARCPMIYDIAGTPCRVSLVAESRRDGDRISRTGIAIVAMMILASCDKEHYGGIASIGDHGFKVIVDTPFANGLRPLLAWKANGANTGQS